MTFMPTSSSYGSIWRCSLTKFALLACCELSICCAETGLRTSAFNKNAEPPLPIFYFHEINGNPGLSANYTVNLTGGSSQR